jgi:hypothetical protein
LHGICVGHKYNLYGSEHDLDGFGRRDVFVEYGRDDGRDHGNAGGGDDLHGDGDLFGGLCYVDGDAHSNGKPCADSIRQRDEHDLRRHKYDLNGFGRRNVPMEYDCYDGGNHGNACDDDDLYSDRDKRRGLYGNGDANGNSERGAGTGMRKPNKRRLGSRNRLPGGRLSGKFFVFECQSKRRCDKLATPGWYHGNRE